MNVRLTLNSQTNNGRVEVQRVADNGRLGIWGTVCDNGFSNTEARVVCRQLGYRYTLNPLCILQYISTIIDLNHDMLGDVTF